MVAEGSVVTGRLLEFRVGPGRFAMFLEDVLGVQDPAEIGAVTDRGVVFQGRPVVAIDARMLWRCGLDPPETIGASRGDHRRQRRGIDSVEG